MRNPIEIIPAGWCQTCGKLSHRSRKAARKFKRIHPPKGVHQSVYKCPLGNGLFHIGRLDAAIISGDITCDAAYGRHRQRLANKGAKLMDTFATGQDGRTKTITAPASNGHRYVATSPGSPGDRTTGQLEILFGDLTTYRFVPQVAVTPILAERLIGLNADNNRNLRPKTLNAYADDMSAVPSRWVEKTGATIVIDTNGRIINGQHRLHAVVRSGKTLHFDLCFGVAPEAMTVIDSGPPRSAVDVIRIAGGDDLTKVAPLVRYVIAFDLGSRMGPAGKVCSPSVLHETYQATAHHFEASAQRGKDLKNRIRIPSIVGAVAHYLIVRANLGDPAAKDVVESFFDQLVAGAGVNYYEGTAIYALRERLISARADRLSNAEQVALVIIAWNRFNTFRADGSRETVERMQRTRGELTAANYPLPRKARLI